MFKKIDVVLPEGVLSKEFNESLVHQVVMAYMNGARSGNVKQKTRSEVRGGGKKPWKQKGTGRARAGTIRSPIWRGGGVTFAAVPRDYSQKVNKKMYRSAFLSIVGELYRKGMFLVVDKLSVDNISSKDIKNKLDELGLKGRILLVSDFWDKDESTKKMFLSARNLKNIYLQDVDDLDPYSLSCVDNLIISKEAFDIIIKRCEYV